MPDRERLSQAGVFIGATLLGLILLVALPRSCSKDQKEGSGPSLPTATAPAPDAIGSRPRKNGFGGKESGPAPAARSPEQAGFIAESVKLSQKPAADAEEEIDDLFTRWGAADAAGAAAYLQDLPAGDYREAAATALCQSWAAADPASAAAWVAKNLGSGNLHGALGAVVSQWADSDAESAAKWVAALPQAEDRTAAESALAQSWGEKNPAAAADWLKNLPAEAQGTAAANLVTGWASADPSAAAQWLQAETAENENIPIDTAGIAVASWVDKDPGAVSKWLNSLPEGPFYETAANAFSQAAAEASPKDALLWAKSLANPAGREHAVLYAMERWFESDRGAFLKALPGELSATKDKAMQRAVYEMLYRKDPSFRESLLDFAANPGDVAADSPPAAPEKAPVPEK